VLVLVLWLPATFLAALFQAWRTAVQQRVRAELSVNAAGLVRYLYGLPVGLVMLLIYALLRQAELPPLGATFLFYCALGGLAQLLATNLLLMAFGYRNYVVGTAYAKTEAIQGAVLALLLLGEQLHLLSWFGIAVGVAGVMVISAGSARLRFADIVQPAALCGIGAGLLFAFTSIWVKHATQTLATADMVFRALLVLVTVQLCQVIMQGMYVLWREPAQMAPVFRTWRVSGQVGVLAALGSACWFTGFATAPVALVRAVGQVEVMFTLGFSRFYLKEAFKPREAAGLLLVGLGVILTLLGAFY
jgi:drug/metabolite transporter (DMT)-like permease